MRRPWPVSVEFGVRFKTLESWTGLSRYALGRSIAESLGGDEVGAGAAWDARLRRLERGMVPPAVLLAKLVRGVVGREAESTVSSWLINGGEEPSLPRPLAGGVRPPRLMSAPTAAPAARPFPTSIRALLVDVQNKAVGIDQAELMLSALLPGLKSLPGLDSNQERQPRCAVLHRLTEYTSRRSGRKVTSVSTG